MLRPIEARWNNYNKKGNTTKTRGIAFLNILFVIKLFGRVNRLAGQVQAELAIDVAIDVRENDRYVCFASAQLRKLLHSQSRHGVGCSRDGKCDQNLICMKSGIVVAQVIDLQVLYGLHDNGREQNEGIVDVAQAF